MLALEDREHFRSVLAEAATAGDLLVVDYFTTWCGPCKLIAPKVEEMAAELAGQGVRFGKVTCDASDDNKRWAQAVKIKVMANQPVHSIMGFNPGFRVYPSSGLPWVFTVYSSNVISITSKTKAQADKIKAHARLLGARIHGADARSLGYSVE